jgi:hypothetical protein
VWPRLYKNLITDRQSDSTRLATNSTPM